MPERERLGPVRRDLRAIEQQLHDLGVVARERAELRQLLERPGVRLVLGDEIAQRRFGELAIADRDLPRAPSRRARARASWSRSSRAARACAECARALARDPALDAGPRARARRRGSPDRSPAPWRRRPRRASCRRACLAATLRAARRDPSASPRADPARPPARTESVSAASPQASLIVARRSSSASESSSEASSDDRRFDRALGAGAVAHHLFEDARQIEPRADAIARRLRPRDAALVELRELLGPAERAVHELERFERVLEERAVVEEPFEDLPARGVIRHALERLAQRRESLRALSELADLQRGEPVQQDPPGRSASASTAILRSSTSARPFVSWRRDSSRSSARSTAGSSPIRSTAAVYALAPARRVVELLLARLAQPDEEIRRDVGVEDPDRSLLQCVRVAPPALGADPVRQPLDLPVEGRVLGLLGQRADQRRLGSLDVPERRLRHLRERAERARAVRPIRSAPGVAARGPMRAPGACPPRGAPARARRPRRPAARRAIRRCCGSPPPTPRRSRRRGPRGTPRAPTARPAAGRRTGPRSASSGRAAPPRRLATSAWSFRLSRSSGHRRSCV